jgi:peptide/nickel transport system permease protein
VVVALVGGVALGADCVASERPILLRYDGSTYLLPNLIEYEELRGLDGDALRDRMTPDDWALWAPVRHGPTSVRSRGELEPLLAPCADHWLGTDDRGRDVLARLVHGTRATAIMALGAGALALLLGLLLSLAAARLGGAVDAAVVATCDVASALPSLLVVIAAQGLIGRATLAAAVVLVALPRAADTARIARASLRATLREPFCDAARALGASESRVLIRHALPHAASQLAVATALTAATAVLAEAALSFVGFGTPPPSASWGELLKQAHENGLRWWLAIPPGLAVAAVAGALGALSQPRETTLLLSSRRGERR